MLTREELIVKINKQLETYDIFELFSLWGYVDGLYDGNRITIDERDCFHSRIMRCIKEVKGLC